MREDWSAALKSAALHLNLQSPDRLPMAVRFFTMVCFLTRARGLAGLAFLILRAAGPARWTARHMYQLATVR